MQRDDTFHEPLSAIIGEGSRRVCYRLGETGTCIKFYRHPSQFQPHDGARLRLFLRLTRFSRTLNVNRQEWRYHLELRRKLPADLLSVFPEHVAPVFSPRLGWGVSESLILNADGAAARKLAQELGLVPDPALRARIYRETETLLRRFTDHGVRFFDLSNLLLQWTGPDTFRLRIADFEPCCRGLPALLTRCSWYVRLKLRRRSARYLARLKENLLLTAETPPPTRTRDFWRRGRQVLARYAGLA